MALLSQKDTDSLADSAFAFIEAGGKKDATGRTVPRSKRHFPVHDAPHVRNALARIAQGAAFGTEAKPKVLAAAKKFGVKVAAERAAEHGLELRRSLIGTAEVRTYTADIELRDDDPGGHFVTVRGVPIAYDTPYEVNDQFGSFTERMRRGCVRDLLANGTDTVLAINHDMKAIPLARTNGGGLELEDSPSGLTFSAQLDTRQSAAADLAIAIENKVIRQMSIGMVVSRDSWNPAQTEREVHALKSLHDISAVTFPASPTTSIALANRSAGRRMTTGDLRRQRELRGRTSPHADRANSDRAFRAETGQLAARAVIEAEQRRVDREIEQLLDGARYAASHGDLVRATLLRTRARRLRGNRNN